jgi:hypothetical protein
VIHFLTIPQTSFKLTDSGNKLKEFESSPGNFRGFCVTCGSSMYWRTDNEGSDGSVDVFLGTLNQEELLGERGKTLCTPTGGRCWSCREIKGVTDPGSGYGGGVGEDEGIRYKTGPSGEKIDK